VPVRPSPCPQFLRELQDDEAVEAFRLEYETLHRALKKSHESERRLLKKCAVRGRPHRAATAARTAATVRGVIRGVGYVNVQNAGLGGQLSLTGAVLRVPYQVPRAAPDHGGDVKEDGDGSTPLRGGPGADPQPDTRRGEDVGCGRVVAHAGTGTSL